MSKLSAELFKLFRYVSFNDKKKVELTCHTIKDVCSGFTFGKNEKFTFYDQGSWFPRLIIEKFDGNVPNLKLTAMMDMQKIPEEVWKDFGSKIHSIEILQKMPNDHSDSDADTEPLTYYSAAWQSKEQFYSKLDNNKTMWNILLNCKNLNYFYCEDCRWRPDKYDDWEFNYEYRLIRVSAESCKDITTVRTLNRRLCSDSKEIYVAHYDKTGQIDMETIYTAEQDPNRRFLLSRVLRFLRTVFHRNNSFEFLGIRLYISNFGIPAFIRSEYTTDSKYKSPQFCQNMGALYLNPLEKIAENHPNLRALTVRLDYPDKRSENASASCNCVTVREEKPAMPLLERLEHLTIYGYGCKILQYFRNFRLPSLKHLDIYKCDGTLPIDGSSFTNEEIASMLEYIKEKMLNLEILCVEDKTEWIKIINSNEFGCRLSNLLILNKQERSSSQELDCCKLALAQNRFNAFHYSVQEYESALFHGWTEIDCPESTSDDESRDWRNNRDSDFY